MAETWLEECDELIISVDRGQAPILNVRERLTATASINAVHVGNFSSSNHYKNPKWLPVRAAIHHAAERHRHRSDYDWLLLAESDTYLRVDALRRYLLQKQLQPSDAHFIGYCRDTRSPGIHLLSRGAALALSPNLRTRCDPIGREGASDVSISHCLSVAGLQCRMPRDAHGDDLLAVGRETFDEGGKAPLANLSAGRRYCYREEFFSWADGACTSKWRHRPPEVVAATVYYPNFVCCNGPDTYAFHPLKRPDDIKRYHRAFTGSGTGRAHSMLLAQALARVSAETRKR